MRTMLGSLMLAGALMAGTAPQAEEVPDIVTIVTSPEPQTQLMGMVLTMQSMQKGAKAHILLCGPGGDLALREAPPSATAPQKPKGMSPQGLMRKIMETGGTVEVCAIYLPNRDLAPDALLDGIGVASPPEMAGRLLADNTRILSF